MRPAGSKQAAVRPAALAGGLWHEEDVTAALLPDEAALPLSEEEVEAARVRADAALDAERAAFEREQGALSALAADSVLCSKGCPRPELCLHQAKLLIGT